MGLTGDIGRGPVALDTSIFIYYIEEHPRYLPLIEPVFQRVGQGRLEVVTSALTLLEVLVVPYRAGNLALAERYEALLTRSRGLRLIELGREQLRLAAHLRAVHSSLRTPDALQVAAALSARAKVLVTNDRQLPTLASLRVARLDDHLAR